MILQKALHYLQARQKLEPTQYQNLTFRRVYSFRMLRQMV